MDERGKTAWRFSFRPTLAGLPIGGKAAMVIQTWFREEAGPVEWSEFCQGTAFIGSFRCPGKLTDNEDAAALIELSPSRGLLAVADGVGGSHAGDRAAQATIESLVQHCRQSPSPDASLRDLVLDAIEAANREIVSWGIGAGATLVVAEFADGNLRVVHIGDAGALVCSNRGRLKYSAVAHAPVAQAVELGMLDESEALDHEDRNIISNCVGQLEMKIEIGPRIKLAARDTLVLASDGLFDNLTRDEIVGIIRAGRFDRKFKQLVEQAKSRMVAEDRTGKPDDLTLICFRQTPPRSPKPDAPQTD